MVEVVMLQFDVTKQPTLIIDNKKYEGVVQKEQMKEIICDSLKQSEHCT
jgi:protein-disulfide isomerase